MSAKRAARAVKKDGRAGESGKRIKGAIQISEPGTVGDRPELWLCFRQGEIEAGAFAGRALHPDAAAVPLDDVPRNRQAEAGAAL